MAESDEGSTADPRGRNWADPVHRLSLGPDADASAINVSGRRLTGPQQGFGHLWRRTYRLDIGTAATPEAAIAAWRAGFGSFWPRGNRFRGALAPLAPGDVAPIAVGTPTGISFATGVFVVYADDRSFTFMTPEGHMFAGWITFAAAGSEPAGSAGSAGTASGTTLEIVALVRPNDPLWDLSMPVMKLLEDRFWSATLHNLGAHLGADPAPVTIRAELVDRGRIWAHWRNVRYNVGIRSAVWRVQAPVRAVRSRRAGRPGPPPGSAPS